MSALNRRLDRVRGRLARPDRAGIEDAARSVAEEFGLPFEEALAEAERLAARPRRDVAGVAADVAAELGLDPEAVLIEAEAIAAADARHRRAGGRR